MNFDFQTEVTSPMFVPLGYATKKLPTKKQKRSFANCFTVTKSDEGAILQRKGVGHKGTIVWLHGLGDSCEGFLWLFEQLLSHNMFLSQVRVVLPNAPARPITINGGMIMRGWYDIYDLSNRGIKEDTSSIQESKQLVHSILDKESKLIGSDKIILGGFSQGGAMSAFVGLQYPKRLSAIVSCSGYVLSGLKEIHPSNKMTPLLASHGTHDQVVPFSWSSETYRRLEQDLKKQVIFKAEIGVGHELSEEFLTNVVKGLLTK